MIEKVDGEYRLVCDVCDELSEEGFEEFIHAVEEKGPLGWKSTKDKFRGWMDVCPECQKEEQR